MGDTTKAMSQKWNLRQKRAVVTGGSQGIGKASAQELLALGAEVMIVGRDEDKMKALIEDWQKQDWKAHYVVADVMTAEGRSAIASKVESEFSGELDVLVNNVGTNRRQKTMEFTEENYRFLMNINLDSKFEMCRLAYPFMKKAGGGSIVNLSSVTGVTVGRNGPPYAMAKAAVAHMSRVLAVEWAPDNITVNTVAPWYTRTPLTASKLDDPELYSEIVKSIPMGRVGEAEDVAQAICFFCLPGSQFITGQLVSVDGGFLAHGF